MIVVGGGLQPPKNSGRSKKPEARTSLKSWGGSLPWVATFKEAVLPLPQGGFFIHPTL